LREAMTATESTPAVDSTTPAPTSPTIPQQADLTWQEKFAQDSAGNTLAVIVLAGMIGTVAWTGFQFRQGKRSTGKNNPSWLVPILCVFGFGVAGYLAYVETAQVAAVCGPVGDCNSVQSSSYAKIWGILPVGLLGAAGYIAILAAWFVARKKWGWLSQYTPVALFGMALFGTIFSIYLTYLELYVI